MFEATLRRLRDPGAAICTSELAAQHTALIEMIHQQGAIETVPPDRVTWVGEKGKSSQVAQIQGLTEALRRSYTAEQSLAASGFPSFSLR
jgi:predicted membrane-bound mannosyltransferase